jgi:HTH-type transcriptional regulator, sugar sensing transcriptional regulator
MRKTETELQVGIFSTNDGINLYEHKVRLEKIKNELIKYGLSPNQAKIYIYLGKYGPKTAPEIFKSLDLPRTETYFILNTLQSKGIVTAECSSPTKYMALPIDKTIAALLNTEKEKINILAQQEKDLEKLWQEIPAYAIETNEIKAERLQMMEGAAQIYSKIKDLVKGAREEFIMFGNEKDISRFYHSDIIETISSSMIDTKVIISPASIVPDFFHGIDKKKIRLIPQEKNNNRCFVIKDNEEVMLAIWSDSKSLVDSIRALFDYSWDNSEVCR